jgi:hypothetical protein
MSKIVSAMYNPETNCIKVTFDNQFRITFNCQNYNAQITLDDPLDISYLTHLAREEPAFYASLASREGGLQGYVEAMGCLIRSALHGSTIILKVPLKFYNILRLKHLFPLP